MFTYLHSRGLTVHCCFQRILNCYERAQLPNSSLKRQEDEQSEIARSV